MVQAAYSPQAGAEAADRLLGFGIISQGGDGDLSLDSDLTRAIHATILVRAAGLSEEAKLAQWLHRVSGYLLALGQWQHRHAH